MCEGLGWLANSFWVWVAKPIFDMIGKCLEHVWNCVKKCMELLWKAVAKICDWIWIAIKEFFKLLYKIVLGVKDGYLGILRYATRTCLKCGLCGELLLIVLTIVWVFWPVGIVVAVARDTWVYYIPTGIFSMIFMILGYTTIKEEYDRH